MEIILDNDRSKAGSLFMGIKVVHPDDEEHWPDLFIIIATSCYAIEIQKQLEEHGLEYKKDFIYYSDYIDKPAPAGEG